MTKTKIAIFDLTGCEGCEFHLLSLDEFLLDFFQDFEITNWRLLSEKEPADFDIAFIEGAVTTKEQINLLKQIRETSKIVVALGACAISGNVFAQLDPQKRKKLAAKIYDKNYRLKAEFLEPVEKFIKVDEKIPGCPPDIELFKNLLEKIKKEKIVSKIKKVTLPDFTSKIEGHGVLKINFKEKRAEFEVEESERLVEGLLLGRDFEQAPFITSRICGICPIAHNLCSWSALENALEIKISQETIILRKILLCGQILKSHLLHLFFLVLPDYAGVKSSIELSKKYPAEFHLMLNLKRVSDKILKVVGGSSAFPSNTMLGGFRNPPKIDELLVIKNSIFEVIDEAQDLIKLFSTIKTPSLKVNTRFKTITPAQGFYPSYPGNFSQSIKEIVKKDSSAKLGVLKGGKIIKVGALARLSHFSKVLHPKAKKVFQKLQLDLNNPFNNNLAQAIEILHFLEETINLIEEISEKDLKKSKGIEKKDLSLKTLSGRSCLEAPRGILSHQVKIDSQGKIIDYNIIPPTQINLVSLEKEMQELVKKKGISPRQIKKQVDQLIRAFDPCITCAVH
ncbi:nickel-dependent hydrogenase large subunit [Patescibacteria group bacterium]|nr:nickel-dependent hydrogenase large subunit [Patescibacteria group bacterium]